MSKFITHHTDTGTLTIVSSLTEPFVSMVYEFYENGAIYSTTYNRMSLSLISKVFESNPMLVNLVFENAPRVWIGEIPSGLFLEFTYIDLDDKKHFIWFNIPVLRNHHKL